MLEAPIIKIELERMRYTLRTMLSQQFMQLDTSMQKAVDEFCTEERMDFIIKEQVAKELKLAIQEAVTSYFQHGEGRKAVEESVYLAMRDKINGLKNERNG